MIDELNDDVWFLALALIRENWTPHHDQLMSSFFAEEFTDAADIVSTRKARNLVSRRKVRAYIANAGGTPDPHRDLSVSETLGGMYSGFVHAAAQHVLTIYGGSPPRFHLAGMLGTPLMQEHTEDSWNYVFRTLQAVGIGAAALGEEELFERVKALVKNFQTSTGRSA
jgi:hypothetical protein